MNDPRVILAVAAEADDDFIWSQVKAIQAKMFAAGPVSIKFAYFGIEGTGQTRPLISERWVTNAGDMVDLMDRGRAGCVCGCYVNIGDVLVATLEETRKAPVQALVIVGDRFHGDFDEAITRAKQLRAEGTRLFLFQQSRSSKVKSDSQDAFRDLAQQTDGAYFQFNPAVERVAERIPGILEAVTHFAIGGVPLLKALDNQSAALLLEQISMPPAIMLPEKI